MITVFLPEQLKKMVGTTTLKVDGVSTVLELIDKLDSMCNGIKARTSNSNFVLFFVNGEDIRFLQDKQTALKSGDEVSIVPAIAGG